MSGELGVLAGQSGTALAPEKGQRISLVEVHQLGAAALPTIERPALAALQFVRTVIQPQGTYVGPP